MAVACLWFPDWPAHAATDDPFAPCAIVKNHEIIVLNNAARHLGLRRGMRERHAKSIAPHVTLCPHDPQRDARLFDAVAESLDAVAAGVEIIRPGLVVVAWDALVKFYRAEDTAMEKLLTAASTPGVDTCIGVADEVSTAILSARHGRIVPSGESCAFLAGISLRHAAAEESFDLCPDTLATLQDAGLTTLGDVAALTPTAMMTRFGMRGARIVDIALGRDTRRVAPALPAEERAVRIVPAEPITRVDEAAFCARQVGAELAAWLRAQSVVCRRLKISVEFTDPTSGEAQWCSRTWHTHMAVDEKMIAERIRWQLDGWLSSGTRGVITVVEVDPVECVIAPDGELWDAGKAREEAARSAAVRVQAHLGAGAVLQPSVHGGVSPTERVTLLPYGDAVCAEDTRTWPGRLTAPHPAHVGSAPPEVTLRDAAGRAVIVTAGVVLSGTPHTVKWGHSCYTVEGWSALWPAEEHWWDSSAPRMARMQLVARDERGMSHAWLMVWRDRQWHVEAAYA